MASKAIFAVLAFFAVFSAPISGKAFYQRRNVGVQSSIGLGKLSFDLSESIAADGHRDTVEAAKAIRAVIAGLSANANSASIEDIVSTLNKLKAQLATSQSSVSTKLHNVYTTAIAQLEDKIASHQENLKAETESVKKSISAETEALQQQIQDDAESVQQTLKADAEARRQALKADAEARQHALEAEEHARQQALDAENEAREEALKAEIETNRQTLESEGNARQQLIKSEAEARLQSLEAFSRARKESLDSIASDAKTKLSNNAAAVKHAAKAGHNQLQELILKTQEQTIPNLVKTQVETAKKIKEFLNEALDKVTNIIWYLIFTAKSKLKAEIANVQTKLNNGTYDDLFKDLVPKVQGRTLKVQDVFLAISRSSTDERSEIVRLVNMAADSYMGSLTVNPFLATITIDTKLKIETVASVNALNSQVEALVAGLKPATLQEPAPEPETELEAAARR